MEEEVDSVIMNGLIRYIADVYNRDPSPNTSITIPDEDASGKFKPFAEEKLDRLVQQRKLFVLEPCSFEGEDYYLLSSKNVKEIYRNTENVMMTIQGVWGELKQYQNEYGLGEPKQRRLKHFRGDRARGILLTPKFIIDLLNNEIILGEDNVDEES